MNYYAHGGRYVDDPYFLAGTAIPDWLGVADRGLRLPPRVVRPWIDGTDPKLVTLARGILQHHEDDAEFHANMAFARLQVTFGRALRHLDPEGNDHVRGLLAHIVPELLLDAVLIEDDPSGLERYYEAVSSVDVPAVTRMIGQMAGREPIQLSKFVDIFLHERFLADYLRDEGLCFRLNQVLRRVGVGMLPAGFETLLPEMRAQVREARAELLSFIDE